MKKSEGRRRKAAGGRQKAKESSDFRLPTSEFARGFTLLEIVLALGLSSLLLAALYTALQMHWSSSSLGQVEMERSQVARALFRRIETDLRSVVFRDTALTSSTDDGSSSSSSSASSGSTSSGNTSSGTSTGTSGGSSSSGSSTGSSGSTSSGSSTGTSSSTGTTTENYSTQKTGLFGDSQTLVAHVSLPDRASSMGAASSGNASGTAMSSASSDLQSVAYFMLGSSSTLAQQLTSALSSPLGKQATGLARMQGDRMAMQAADETGDLSSMSSGVKVLAPEVASISFEYFDGVSWTTSWDSATSNSIPNAVRITIDFQPPVATSGWYSRPVSASTDRFQHTVALPLAPPYVPEDSL